jgi:amino acid transporter
VGIVLVLTIQNLLGVVFGGRTNTVLTAIKLLPLLAFIPMGLAHLRVENLSPFAPHGYDAIGTTSVLLMYAFVGFEGMAIPAGEMTHPKRDIPRALLMGMCVILILYLGIWVVCFGTVGDLQSASQPVAAAAATFMGTFGTQVIRFGILASVVGINAFMALTTPRALYALSLEGHLPRGLARTNRRGSPAVAILVTSGLVLGLSLNNTFEQLAVISVVARLAQYIPTAAAVLKLRAMPNAPQASFRVPFGPLLPCAGIGVCFWLLIETPGASLLSGFLALLVGLIIYYAYRLSRRYMGRESP